MFDFFNLEVPVKYAENLFKNPNLNFEMGTSRDGIIKTTEQGSVKYKALFRCFEVIIWEHTINPIKIEIKGSFHKLYEGGTNYKDFSFNDFRSAINMLSHSFNIPPTELYIHSFEIGVNINPPIETKLLLEGIKSLSGKKFERETYKDKGLLFRFDFSQYQVKIYDKGFQFMQNQPILRFELKVKKMDFIKNKRANITTLDNLISGDWNNYFKNLLLSYWDKVIICPEGMINANLIKNPRTYKNFTNGLNPDYWTKLSSKAYNRQFYAFKEVFRQFAPIDLYSEIKLRIRDKWEQLSKDQKGINDPYIYSNIIPFDIDQPKQRFCRSCGRNISNQKKDSKFCSETLYGPEVKKCRNIDSNPRNNRKRKEQRLYPGPTLFPVFIHMGIL